MHDPQVVAFTVRRPWPVRQGRETSGPRWRVRYERARWFDLRPCVFLAHWTLAGRCLWWPSLVTVWHTEPGGRNALTVCRGRRWQWHVHHWRVQVHPVQRLHRWLFERCEECGRRYPWRYGPVAHQWDQPRGPWFRVTRRAFHRECSSLVHLRRTAEQDAELVHRLVGLLCEQTAETELEAVARLTGLGSGWEFYLAYRLQRLLGYERDDGYNLRRVASEGRGT